MSPPLYQLRGASLHGPERPILEALEWSVPDHSSCVIYGAGGAGKTTLLRALTGQRLPPVQSRGSWSFRGRDLLSDEGRAAASRGLIWCPQPPRQWTPRAGDWGPGLSVAAGRAGTAKMMILDEPDRWVVPEERQALSSWIQEFRGRIPILLSTHHVEFGRACADEVCLLGDCRILESSSADSFFGSPSAHARQLLTVGAVWPKPSIPTPSSFRWVVPGALGGMAQPGLVRSLDDDLLFCASIGVNTLISLTKAPFDPAQAAGAGISNTIHLPIPDMGVPSLPGGIQLARQARDLMDEGQVVIFHCKGGLGRTGLMLALVLLTRGWTADAAVQTLREIQPLYIQSPEQLAFVHTAEPYLRPTTENPAERAS